MVCLPFTIAFFGWLSFFYSSHQRSPVTLIIRLGLNDYKLLYPNPNSEWECISCQTHQLNHEDWHAPLALQLPVSSSLELHHTADKAINTAETQRSSAAISQEPKHLTHRPLLLYFTCDSLSWRGGLRNRSLFHYKAAFVHLALLIPLSLPLRSTSLSLHRSCYIIMNNLHCINKINLNVTN